jgi:hypothetical protein
MSENKVIYKTKSNVNHDDVSKPSHYNVYDIEVIDMMLKIWGKQAVINYCLLNAFKYRMRAGNKENNSSEKDFAKEQWYLNKVNEIKNN